MKSFSEKTMNFSQKDDEIQLKDAQLAAALARIAELEAKQK